MSSDNLEGRFTVKGQLRCSGVGSLVCAEDNKDGARTAIRLIPEVAQGKAAVAAALKMPVHPVLPRAIGSGAFNGSSWVAIDFPEGELLAQKLPLDANALLTMGSMVAGALTALHQNHIVHGELSTESVLVVPARAANSLRYVLFDAPLVVMNRLTDRRGEERLLSQLTHLVPFLSPERARGVEATEASDVWALGMILSLASGARGVPGDSTLEKIAAIVTNKWRPAVSASLPIALRLLLTRMLAPDPKDRPSSLDVALELEHLCVAFTAHQQVTAHAAQTVDTAPVAQFRIDKLLAQAKSEDPFEALVAHGVTAKAMDPHAEPTKQVVVPLAEVTDPRAPMPVPGPTAPERGQKAQVVTQPAAPPAPSPRVRAVQAEPAAAPAPSPRLRAVHAEPVEAAHAARHADEIAAMPVIAPAHPSQRRTPMPLPPILDPSAVVVAPQPIRLVVPAPMPKVQAPVHEVVQPQTETMRYGALPGAQRPPKVPASIVTEDVAEEAAQARAERRAEQAVVPLPAPAAAAQVVHTDVSVPSVHDQAEEEFAQSVRAASKRRYRMLGIAAGVILLGVGGWVGKSMLDAAPAAAPEVKRAARPERAKKLVAAAEPEAVRDPEVAELHRPAPSQAVVAEPAVPAPKPEPVAVKAEPAPGQAEGPVAKAAPPAPKAAPSRAEAAEPVAAKPAPAVKPAPSKAEAAEPVAAAKPAAAPRAEPVAAKPAPAPKARPVAKKEEAPRRPASRLDEGD